MAFKGNSDDVRSSLSYKLKRILRFKAGQVLCHDPYVKNDSDLSDLDAVLTQSDILILGAPHDTSRGIGSGARPLIDIWSMSDSGILP